MSWLSPPDRKRDLRNAITQLRAEVATLKKYSFLIGTTDPYIVIPGAFTRGKDAVGEVFMKVDFGKVSFIGKAASTDIVDASARAYLNAINKVVHYQMALEEHKNISDSAQA